MKLEVKIALEKLYRECFATGSDGPVEFIGLPQAGGDRIYFRLRGSAGTCIGTYDEDSVEAKCFVKLARDFHDAGCSVPRIFACSDIGRCYLQEDLGDTSLFSILASNDSDGLVRETIDQLVQLQKTPQRIWVDDVVVGEFCRRQVMWDLNYFKYEFLKPSGVIFDEQLLEDDFERLCEDLVGIPQRFWGFMMRDCQSRNVMIAERSSEDSFGLSSDTGEKKPVFIDFQGGRRGPALYDAVSLLWQARAGFSSDFRNRMLTRYADEFCGHNAEESKLMLSYKGMIVLFRTLQVLGAYGFRGLVQHRSHFIMSIPGAVKNLMELISDGAIDKYPEMKRVCSLLVNDSRFIGNQSSDSLRVEVFSFSYKKGYPQDMSGNGGGFMFDCRAMHNPGRYKEYKSLTGRDLPVVKFLEKRGEVQRFLNGAWSLTDPAVERYLSRGFSNLQIGFGCTGGQHRSVYCAEATARHLKELFPEANVTLVHREQS